MKWTAIFYSENGRKPVLEYIGSLEPKAEAKILRNVAILEEFGPDIGYPLVSNVSHNIWELRTVFGGSQHRILFSVLSGRIILLTTAFGKKTRKIPNKEIELAAHRLQKYWEENRK